MNNPTCLKIKEIMAVIRKNDVVKERPVIIVLYGTPGTGKTSLATTADSPLLIDTDRGFDRAVQRPDIVVTASQWEDIYNEEIIGKYVIENGVQVWKPGLISECKTVVVDTAKAMLDEAEKSGKLKKGSVITAVVSTSGFTSEAISIVVLETE